MSDGCYYLVAIERTNGNGEAGVPVTAGAVSDVIGQDGYTGNLGYAAHLNWPFHRFLSLRTNQPLGASTMQRLNSIPGAKVL
jgi:hypothetical protein